MEQNIISLEVAINVFTEGFCFAKSRTYPFAAFAEPNMIVMRDDPVRKTVRKTEIVAWGISPEEAIDRVRASHPAFHFLSYVHSNDEDFEDIRRRFKQAGYRAMLHELFFVHDLKSIPPLRYSSEVERLTGDQVEWEGPQFPKHLEPRPPIGTRYRIWHHFREVASVMKVPVGPDHWVSDLYVVGEERRKGYATDLMCQLLFDAQEAGERSSILLANTSGAKLYPRLGYQKIGTLQLFCPLER